MELFSLNKSIIFVFLVTVLLVSFSVFFSSEESAVQAATNNDNECKVEGDAFSEGVGWISFSGNIGNDESYGVIVDEDGWLEGYAYSSYLNGLIRFGGNENQNLNPNPRLENDGITGYARFCNVYKDYAYTNPMNTDHCSGDLAGLSERGGWDGWIDLSGISIDLSSGNNQIEFGGIAEGFVNINRLSFNSNSPLLNCQDQPVLCHSFFDYDPLDPPQHSVYYLGGTDCFPEEEPVMFELIVEIEGGGSVNSDDGAISCSNQGGNCSAFYEEGDSVTLYVVFPQEDFIGWSENCEVTDDFTCVVIMNSNQEVIATFDEGDDNGIDPKGESPPNVVCLSDYHYDEFEDGPYSAEDFPHPHQAKPADSDGIHRAPVGAPIIWGLFFHKDEEDGGELIEGAEITWDGGDGFSSEDNTNNPAGTIYSTVGTKEPSGQVNHNDWNDGVLFECQPLNLIPFSVWEEF